MAIRCIHANRGVVYTFQDNTWKPETDNQLADIFVTYSSLKEYTIIARLPGEPWVINSHIFPTFTIQKISSFFVQWRDPRRIYGVAFPEDEHCNKFYSYVYFILFYFIFFKKKINFIFII